MTDCEQQIYSNEYQDYLIEHTGDEALIKQWYVRIVYNSPAGGLQ